MNNKGLIIAIASLGALVLGSCGNGNKWTVKGQLDPSAGNMVAVEASDNGRWYLLDSVKVDKNGKFSYSHEAQGYSDVFRLHNDNLTVYFPIDSIETVTVALNDGGYSLAGSQQAEMMMRADSIINSAAPEPEMKNAIAQLILTDPSSITAYYVINRKIGGKPLLDPSVKNDHRLIGAVANAYNDRRPSDPRTAYLKRLYLDNRQRSGEGGVSMVANEIGAPEINLYDNKGERRSLQEVISQGKVVILNFTVYSAEESPAFNVLLNSIYEKYGKTGLEIYQVALDENEYAWKRTADNLPWITVMNDVHNGEQVLLDYNVGSLPTVFIIDRNGEVVERVTDLGQLDALVARYM